MVAQFAGFLAVACYLVASGILCYRLVNKQTASKVFVLSLGAIALPLHGFNIQQHIYSTQGLDLGFFNIISLIAWLIACIHIAISSYRPLFVMSIFAFPMAAFGLVLSEIFHAPYQPLTHLPKGAESHIILSILAYSVINGCPSCCFIGHTKQKSQKTSSTTQAFVNSINAAFTNHGVRFI